MSGLPPTPPQPTHGDAPYSLPRSGAVPPAPGARKPWWKRKRVIIPAGFVALIIVIGAINGAGGDPDETAVDQLAATSQPEAEEQKSAEETAAEAEAERQAQEEAERKAEEERAAKEEAERIAQEEAERKAEEERAAAEAAVAEEAARIGTVSQQNAYRSATNYLDLMGFSRARLIDQLTSEFGEGYPHDDAEFAIARIEAEGGVDWNAEAVEAAQNYLDLMGFSRARLIDQLTSEYGDGFTREQAEYAADQVGL